MFSEKKQVPNPLDDSSPVQSESDQASLTKLDDLLRLVGYLTLLAGFIVAIMVGVSLKTVEISSFTGYARDVPHPHRWLYALGVFISSIFSGLLMLGVGRTLTYLEELRKK